MGTPAKTQPGLLDSSVFTAGGAVELRDFRPHPQAVRTVFSIRIDQPGDLTVSRVNPGRISQLIPVQSLLVTPEEESIILDFPFVGDVRLSFTNTNATPGTITVDATSSGQGSAGRTK